MESGLPHESMIPQLKKLVVARKNTTDDIGADCIGSCDMMAILSKIVVGSDKSGTCLLEDVNQQPGFSPDTAHLAAELGLLSILEVILKRCPSLFFLRNSRGDTPLHVGARAGELGIVLYLLTNCNSRDVQRDGGGGVEVAEYLKMENEKGNSALHEALEYDRGNVAKFLVGKYPELSFSVNKVGRSPAYMAAEEGRLSLLQEMLRFLDTNKICEWRVMTPLHAAILTRRRDIVQYIIKDKPQLIRATDKKGRNPLHYAASMGYYYALSKFLKADSMAAFLPDDDGLYPIHMAASSGHVKIIQLLLEFCSLYWALQSKTGQNFLHVAAESGKVNVVKHILETGKFDNLLNRVDGKGNTALHLATKGRHYKVVRALSSHSKVITSITNNDNLTALDIAEEHIVIGATFRRLLTLTALRIANAPRARILDIFSDKPDGKHLVDNDDQRSVDGDVRRTTDEFYKDRVNTLLLTSTLVATVTFTAGFTIPGGLNNSGAPDQGIATMLTKNMFKAFVICDAISLFCSIFAVVFLIWAQVGDALLMRSILGFTLPLLGISLSMMAMAFSAALYIVTSQLHWLAALVLIMATIFLTCTVALLLPLRMPMQSRHRFFQKIIYYFLYLLEYAAVGNDDSDINGDSNRDADFLEAARSFPRRQVDDLFGMKMSDSPAAHH